ncbi:synaptotagmin-17-like [Tubulanus polymorphus]|uniref:synaptotagmin-17-like n=1 Tax=Tubulanus polymorphus TaxID=672921 RepID=UPI003DA35F79
MSKYTTKIYDVSHKILEIICCRNGCCDTWFEPDKKKQVIQKKDIEYQFREPESIRLNSDSESVKSLSIGRDRLDSDNSAIDSICSTSSLEGRRAGTTPVIDMKPIEFWTANRETVQPRTPRRRLASEQDIDVSEFRPDLYSNDSFQDECLTDEEKLARFKLGQVHFSLQYEIPSKTLIVKVIEARDLPPPYCLDRNRHDMAHSNPYAKVALLPDQKNSYQTSVQRKTQCPVWGEMFSFELPYKEAQRRTLEIIIKDFDKFSRHCVIGQIHLPLENVNIIKGRHMWKPLMPSTKERQDLGEILLSINYLPSAGRLNIDVIKAKQLLQTDLVGGSDPFVKVTLLYDDKAMKTKKTSTKKNTIDPVFNESFNFNVTPEQLEHTSVAVTVWDYNSKSKDDFVGRIVIGTYTTGPHEITHWNRMIRSPRSPVAQWHTLRSRKECDSKVVIMNSS